MRPAAVIAAIVAALFAIVGVAQLATGRVGPAVISGVIAWLLWAKVVQRQRPEAA